jgi:hypothetical protein
MPSTTPPPLRLRLHLNGAQLACRALAIVTYGVVFGLFPMGATLAVVIPVKGPDG